MLPINETNTNQVLTCEEVAKILKVSEHTVKNLHRTNQLKAVKIGAHNRWRPKDVFTFVNGLNECDDRS